MRVALPSLDDLEIATPCPADWAAMPGDDRVRFCPRCRQNVYNLSALTADEATALLRANEKAPCVRFYRRRDGMVMTADCPVGVRRIDRLPFPWRWAAVALAAAFPVIMAFIGWGGGRGSQACMGSPPPLPTAAPPVVRDAPAVHPPQHVEGAHPGNPRPRP